MPLRKKIRTTVSIVVMVFILVQISSCGFILYPERKGRPAGRIDPGVAILDAILLIPGILPGVVAFAVDFVTGCIYLPGGSVNVDHVTDGQDPKQLARATDNLDLDTLNRLLSEKAGHSVQLDKKNIQVLRINDNPYMIEHFTDKTISL